MTANAASSGAPPWRAALGGAGRHEAHETETMPFAPNGDALVTTSDAPVTNSLLLLVAMPGAPSSVLAPSFGSVAEN